MLNHGVQWHLPDVTDFLSWLVIVTEIYKVVSAVLHLGNIRFVEKDDSHTATGTSISGVESSCERSLQAICSLLGFHKEDFMEFREILGERLLCVPL